MTGAHLPPQWRWATLADVADWGSGGTPKATNATYYDGDIPWAVIGDLNDGLVRTTATTISAAGLEASSAKIVEQGTVLVAMYGSIGKLGIAGKAMATNQAIAFARPKPEVVTAGFLFWWLFHQRSLLRRAGKGATQLNISQQVLKPWPIALPPLSEQRIIVSAIEAQISRLDAGIHTVALATSRLSRLRQHILDTVTGGTRESASMPTGWSVSSLDQLLVGIEAGKSFKCEERPAGDNEWGVIKVSAMTWGQFNERENKTVTMPDQVNPAYEIRPGDLLLSRANTVEYVGAAVYVERCRPHLLLSDKSMRLRPAATADPRWLRLALGSAFVRRQIMEKATGTSDSMRNISQAKVRQLKILTPPKEQQAVIAQEWSRLSSKLDSVAQALSANVARSGQLRWAILAAAFTGRLPPAAEVGHAEFVKLQVLETVSN